MTSRESQDPVILVVSAPGHRDALAGEFASRYDRDYDVRVVTGAHEASVAQVHAHLAPAP